jgi:eukaryotic translation initiation factor 2C
MSQNTPRPRVPTFGAGPAAVEFCENSSPTGQRAYISVATFFKRQYKYTNLDTALPVVNVGSRQKPVYLPAEICDVLRGQPCTAKLSPEQTSQMINFAVRRPAQNATSITTKGVETVRLPNGTLRHFNLAVNPQLITIPGRILNPPNVVYKNKITAITRNGGWNMAKIQFNNGATLPPWTYLMLSLPWKRKTDAFSSPVQAEATLSRFHSSLTLNGLTGPAAFRRNPGRLQLQNDDGDYGRLDKVFDQILSTPQKPRLILVILTDSDAVVYRHLKLLGDVRKGIHLICVVGSKLATQTQRDPENLQYFANVALKFNIRLGGTNQILPPTKLGILDEGKTMVVGIDVTHPSPGSSEGAPSVAAIVASVDKNLAQFLADIQINPSRQEPVENLVGMMKSRLQLWQRKNGNLPENVIVYRDGVSDGQYNIVLDQELPKLREACKILYPANSPQPKMTIIIVGKRHHTRFYPTKAADADERSANTKNGTVVDRGVTEARLWDFFLQAHSSGLGRPALRTTLLSWTKYSVRRKHWGDSQPPRTHWRT